MSDLKMHVLFRFSKKTGKIDTTMTGLGNAMMKLWALNNTTKTKGCIIAERDTGVVVFTTSGTENFPKVKDATKHGDLGTIEDFGISVVVLQSIKDDRFDSEA